NHYALLSPPFKKPLVRRRRVSSRYSRAPCGKLGSTLDAACPRAPKSATCARSPLRAQGGVRGGMGEAAVTDFKCKACERAETLRKRQRSRGSVLRSSKSESRIELGPAVARDGRMPPSSTQPAARSSTSIR